jgi:hypothetical protein
MENSRSPKDIFKNITNKIKEKNTCCAIIKIGKNKNTKCGRYLYKINGYVCKINNHEKYNNRNNQIGKCKIIINKGENKGKICGRFKCSYHKSRKYANIATYMKLPVFFEDLVKEHRNRDILYGETVSYEESLTLRRYGFKFSQPYINIEEIYNFMSKKHLSNENSVKISMILCKIILSKIRFNELNFKILLITILFKLLDTEQGKILLKNKKFYDTSKSRLSYIKSELDSVPSTEFTRYLIENFTTDGLFFEKRRNDNVEKIKNIFEDLVNERYMNTLENRYKPNGTAFLELQTHFYKVASDPNFITAKN